MTESARTELLNQIHDLINGTFNLDEFRELCYRLGEDYDNLRGETKSARIRDLIQKMDRRRRLDDLLNFCARLRPGEAWPDLSVPVDLDATPKPFAVPKRNPRQIFLSHARQDADFAHKLAADLRFHDWQVWIAPDSIQPGESWVNAINRGLAESGIFLLTLTPDAVNSTWVQSETNVAISLQHQKALHFIPLDVKTAAVPPLWQAYQWISFRRDYKNGLEQLLRELQPEKMAQVTGLYQQMQEAVGRQEWALVQKVGAEINALYPDYRETEMQIALARQEETRQKGLQGEAAKLYKRLHDAFDLNDWAAVLTLTRQIDGLIPNYKDVNRLAARARRGQRQNQLDVFGQHLRFIPVWGWGSGIVVVTVFALIFFFQMVGGGVEEPPATPVISVMLEPTYTLESLSTNMPQSVSTATDMPPTYTATHTNTPEPTNTTMPTNTATPVLPTHIFRPTITNTPINIPTIILPTQTSSSIRNVPQFTPSPVSTASFIVQSNNYYADATMLIAFSPESTSFQTIPVNSYVTICGNDNGYRGDHMDISSGATSYGGIKITYNDIEGEYQQLWRDRGADPRATSGCYSTTLSNIGNYKAIGYFCMDFDYDCLDGQGWEESQPLFFEVYQP